MPTVKDTPKEAIILLAHGSRVPEAGNGMERVVHRLREKLRDCIVEACYMSRLGPHFPEVFERCVAGGAKKIILIPYFLHTGLHIVLDIPKMMQEKVKEFPGVKLILGKPLGFDECLVDLVARRVEESRAFGDVRGLKLKTKDKYPLPPGQYEFVMVPPENAGQGSDHDSHS